MAESLIGNGLATPPSRLTLANRALREGRWVEAMQHYLSALRSDPTLARLIAPNLDLLRRRHQRTKVAPKRLRIGVCGWDLAHNAAGRVYTLAQIHARYAEVEIIGCLFPQHGTQIWAPIRNEPLPPVHTMLVDDEERFLAQAVDLVAAHPYDIVHLSKPRMPNVFIGLLYRLLWGARVIMDIDDEELSFVESATSEVSGSHPTHPERTIDLDGRDWTRVAVSMARDFDAVTVANAALQQRYGGEIVPHARDETLFVPANAAARTAARREFELPLDRTIVMFLGTPRQHKGLLRLAQALAATEQSDVVLAVFGDFDDPEAKEALLAVPGVECILRPMVPFGDVPRVLAAADCCVLLQDPRSMTARFQTPAKLTDALAMALPVAVTATPGVDSFIAAAAVVPLNDSDIAATLRGFLQVVIAEGNHRAREYFVNELSIQSVSRSLRNAVSKLMAASFGRFESEIIELTAGQPSLNALLKSKRP